MTWRAPLPVFALLALAGCGNAYESVSVGDWQEIGRVQPPHPDTPEARGDLVITRLAEGRGKPVKAGDLVQVRIGATDGHFQPSHMSPSEFPQTQVVWLWAGQEPSLNNYNDFMNQGSLGSSRLRMGLIGKSVGERLQAKLEPTAEGLITIPLKGFTVQHWAVRFKKDLWPEFHFGKETTVEVEVLNACEAKLYRKTATIRQAGYILNMFGSGWRSIRQGTVTWGALETQCPQKVRFEIGPLYFPVRGTAAIYSWWSDYPDLGESDRYWKLLGIRVEIWLLALVLGAGLRYIWRRGPKYPGY